MEKNRKFGQFITQLIDKKNLSQKASYDAFCMTLKNEVSDMQQGAFLAAITSKGETAAEVAGGWQAVYGLDTTKVELAELPIVDNCGTGMDSFKTFNISTAASLIAAAGGVIVARHGARAISSSCGTVDIAECLGIDVECSVDVVKKSIQQAGIGLFNGMSPEVHPMALGRILSQINFGSPLNIAASLAHPAMPKIAVRGVYSKTLLRTVADVMQAIGYTDALVVYGGISGSNKGMDEGSVSGTTFCIHLKSGMTEEFSFDPEEVGLVKHDPQLLAGDSDKNTAALKMYKLLAGRGDAACSDSVILNSALIFYVQNITDTIAEGVEKAREILESGQALVILKRWVEAQNTEPSVGLAKLAKLEEAEVVI